MTEPVSITVVSDLLVAATDQLSAICDTPRLDAEVLLAHALGQDRSWLYAHNSDSLSESEVAVFTALINKRNTGEPVAYLTGVQEFWSLPIQVSPAVLVPRNDTELLVELTLQHLDAEHQSVLELGTGTAAIAIALSIERPTLDITATDVSPSALKQAQINIDQHQCSNITLLRSDWFAALDTQQFDQLVSNPPYIAENDPHLKQGDLPSEPLLALSSGGDGMDAIRHIISHASPYLRSGALLLLEHGFDQAQLVQQLLQQHGYQSIKTYKDLGDNDRVTCAVHP